MKKYFLLLILISSVVQSLHAQIIGSGNVSNELRGFIVTDSMGMSCVPYAHVSFIHKKDTVTMAANMGGMFSYKGQITDSMRIRVTAVGYKTFEGYYFPKKHGFEIKILMEQESITLNEIIIKGKMVAMVVKGDTLQYNAEAFLTLEGDLMDKILQKIPGVAIKPGGEITVNGERISKIYVNGDHQLFQTTGEAIKRIEADNVKNIKVYDEIREEDKKAGLKYGKRETVMNVTTKKEVKKGWKSSNISIGGGFDFDKNRSQKYNEKYDLKMSYSNRLSKRSINMDGYYSNRNPLLSVDLKEFGGSFGYRNSWKYINNLSLDVKYKNGTVRDHLLEEYSYFPTEEYESRSFTNSKSNKNQREKLNVNFNTRIKGKSNTLSLLGSYNYDVEDMKNNEFSIAMMDKTELNHSYIIDSQKKYTSHILTNFSFQHYLPNSYRLTVGGLYNNRTVHGYGFRQDTVHKNEKQLDIDQTINNKSDIGKLSIKLSKTLNDLWAAYIGGGFSYDKSSANEIATDCLTGMKDSINTRDYSIYYESIFGEIYLSYMDKKFNLDLTSTITNTKRKHREQFPFLYRSDEDFVQFSSKLEGSYKFSTASKMRFKYTIKYNLPTVEETRSVINNINPLWLKVGNPNIEQPREHLVEWNFNKTYVSTSSAIELKLNYQAIENYITQNSQYFTQDTYLPEYNYTALRGATLLTSENSGTFHQFKGNMIYSTLSDPLKSKLKFSLEYLYEHRPSFFQGESNNWDRNKVSFALDFISNFSRKVELSLNSETGLNRNKSQLNAATDIFNENITFNVRTTIIPKFNINVNFLYNYHRRCSEGTETHTKNLAASISRNLNKKTTLSLNGYNLLNSNASKSLDKTSEYWVYKEWSYTGRCIMATLKYSF